MNIGSHKIGKKPFLIAEAGLNHNGKLDIAMTMVDEAKKAGCDAIKFQTYKADEFCPKYSDYYRIFKRCELDDMDWPILKDWCDQQEIMFLSTPQNESDLERILHLIPAIKVGSDDLTNTRLIMKYAETGKPLILSTGMSTIEDVHAAVDAAGDAEIALMVCTSLYPCPPDLANLERIRTLQMEYPTIPIGFSDHTIGVEAAMVAAAFGATIFECHFTLDNNMNGPDHGFSKNPDMLKWWVEAIHRGIALRGDGEFELSEEEKSNKIKYQRQSGQVLRRA